MALIQKPKWFGVSRPFIIEGTFMSRQQDVRLIKNDLVQLLLTSPGERVMRPDFGTLLRRFLFSNITRESLSILRENILDAIAKYEPRITVNKFVIRDDAENNQIILDMYCSVNNDPALKFLFELPIPLGSDKIEVKGNVRK